MADDVVRLRARKAKLEADLAVVRAAIRAAVAKAEKETQSG